MPRFAADAVLAYWNGDGDETAARAVVHGRAAIDSAIASSGGGDGRCTVLVSLRDGEGVFTEGVLRGSDGASARTFVTAAQLDRNEEIARCVAFHCPLVEPSPSWEHVTGVPSGDARALLGRYFRHLVGGELTAATECFSRDCLYSHPPYAAGTPRVEFRGRDELLDGFRTTRGRRSSRPQILHCVQRGADAFIEGVVDGVDGPKGTFVSSASLDHDGLLRRYVAFYTTSRVPRR